MINKEEEFIAKDIRDKPSTESKRERERERKGKREKEREQ